MRAATAPKPLQLALDLRVRSRHQESVILSLLLAAYACARLFEAIPTPLPRMAIVALDVLSALGFACVHGARRYGLRTIAVFTLLCVAIGNIVENIGVATGIPFGRYEFLELMGPRLLRVPILLGLAYMGMAYVSFELARIILPCSIRGRTGLLAIPALAGFIMTLWDVAQDPIWSTVLHGWVWRDGGRWFGVPVSNYLGWYATNVLIALGFAVYLRSAPQPSNAAISGPGPGAFYLTCAVGNILPAFLLHNGGWVADPTGKLWRVADIVRASAVVSLVGMGSIVVLAWLRRKSAAAID